AGQSATQKDPISAVLRSDVMHEENFIAKAAEKMPEEFYGMRPGPQMEVRTFGQIIGHLANFSYIFCSDAKGEKNPKAGVDYEKLTSKADLINELRAAFGYCDEVYSSMTDARLTEAIQATRDDGSKISAPRISRLIANISHDEEHYGNIVTYMRIKSLVPPSSSR
ncbi:MAG: DinB family protein, partial [Candidatus Acidiferrales bacterium]